MSNRVLFMQVRCLFLEQTQLLVCINFFVGVMLTQLPQLWSNNCRDRGV